MTMIPIRDVSLFVDVVGRGYPLLLIHGGPGLDHWSLAPLRGSSDRCTLVFYDQRCNGRSVGPPVTTMTWDNLTADAEVLREKLGFERWAVLGHSFGGHVALEYALRYPDRVSHLVLLDTGGDNHWSRENAPRILASRGYSPEKVELVRRFFTGEMEPREAITAVMKFGTAYYSKPSLTRVASDMIRGEWHTRFRPEVLTYAGRYLLKGWSVIDRLGEIHAPTLVMAGRDDFLFPPECQHELVAGIANSRLRIIDHAGHNPQFERTAEVLEALAAFIPAAASIQALR